MGKTSGLLSQRIQLTLAKACDSVFRMTCSRDVSPATREGGESPIINEKYIKDTATYHVWDFVKIQN
jgi:hypothetical protein